MKNIFRFFLALCLILTLCLSLSAGAFAGVSNSIKGSGSISASSSYGPSAEDIYDVNPGEYFQMPQSTSYFSDYQFFYVDASKGPSVNTYRIPDLHNKGNKVMPTAYHGTMVMGLAEENGFICGLYYSDNNVYTVGWINADNLSSSFPGKMVILGTPRATRYSYYPADFDWSSVNFVDSKTKFTEINYSYSPSAQVDGICYEYQVISRQGKNVAGQREVYINDGSSWEYVGSFDVDGGSEAVRVIIYFDQPKEVLAVATLPATRSSEGFIFRQFIAGMLVGRK